MFYHMSNVVNFIVLTLLQYHALGLTFVTSIYLQLIKMHFYFNLTMTLYIKLLTAHLFLLHVYGFFSIYNVETKFTSNCLILI